MKNYFKIGLALFIIGAIVFTVAFAAGGFNIKTLSTRPEKVLKTYDPTGDITSVTIRTRSEDVLIEPSSDGLLHIKCYESEAEFYDITNDNGALEMIYRDERKWYQHVIDIGVQHTQLVVQLPEGFAGDASVKNNNGDIQLMSFSAASLQMEADNGKLVMRDVSLTGGLTARLSNGKLEIERTTAGGEVYCKANNGSARIEDSSFAGLDVDADNGSITLDKLSVAGAIDLESDNGSITLAEMGLGESCALHASNGKIRGSLPGRTVDYTIESRADNGKNSLPEKLSGGDKLLKVYANNGNIELTFDAE